MPAPTHTLSHMGCSKCRFNSGPWLSMKHEIAEEPATVRLRHILRPGTWSGLSLLEKIAVVQLVLGACTFVLLVVLVTG